MWSTGITVPAFFIFSLNAFTCSSARSLNFHPLGFREKIWKVSHPISLARSTARSIEPAMETCTPTVTMDRYSSLS